MSAADPAAADDAAHGPVRHWLDLGGAADGWLTELAATEVPAVVPLPSRADAARLLERMGVPPQDVAEALDAAPDPDRHPELWWLLQRCRQVLHDRLGGEEPMSRWPDLPARLGAHGRFFYLWVFLAALPALLDHHESHDVPEEVTWETLADIGSKVVLHRRTHGLGGLDKQDWFTLHLRGLLYGLGRLQFNLSRVRDGAARLTPGTRCLGVHIPETGPMTPEACDRSLARARGFFHRHFGIDCEVATCTSWLLDEQLAEYLPERSNIVRFQRRFQLLPDGRDGDRDIVEFVFRRLDPPLDELPQETTLHRAVVRHLRSGRHWQVRTGWLALD
ncbi:MAG: acyltransferase domain-containing protein [Actinocatenispora sp.]